MKRRFERIISTTQSRYKINLEKKEITQQCSYNLPSEIEDFLKKANAIERETPLGDETNVKYILNTDYSIELSNNIIAIIGDKYNNNVNKVVFTHTEAADGSTIKLQLKKTDFASRGEDYKWFVDLYDKNIEGVNFVVYVDEECHKLSFDLELTKSLFDETIPEGETNIPLENIFDNFQPWLTSKNNPNYTGVEKYTGYAYCLRKLISYMFVNEYLDNEDLNTTDVNWLRNAESIYYEHDDIIEYDKTKLQHTAGIHALKYYIVYIEYLLSLQGNNTIDNESLLKFKKLLGWFVKQLNINNGIEEGKATSGFGYRGDSIRKNYIEWRNYPLFDLDISIQTGINVNKSKANYIHNSNSQVQLSIRPIFSDDNKVEYVQIAQYIDKDQPLNYIGEKYLVDDLKLDDEDVSDLLKELFDLFVKTFIDLQSKKEKVFGAYNKVFYGTPGCGKSYYVQNVLLPDLGIDTEGDCVIRTTFYQDYSNTDFVGQILPKITEKNVTYEFNPGPFTLALKQALAHKDLPVALVIEELNRGNAASIFGDIFQLLDRVEDGSSRYEITNVNIQDYLTKELETTYCKVKIPSNLYIIATMNTSDQNVFTLDTAFKRRWLFEKVSNKFEDHPDHDYKGYFIPGILDKTTWEEMVNYLNDYIVEHANEFMNEDKQIGVYFMDKDGLAKEEVDISDPQKIKEFSYKMLEYLWDDVAKFNRKDWFNDIKTLDELIDEYKVKGKGVFNNGVFKKQEDK